jgi:hypothetical protein
MPLMSTADAVVGTSMDVDAKSATAANQANLLLTPGDIALPKLVFMVPILRHGKPGRLHLHIPGLDAMMM